MTLHRIEVYRLSRRSAAFPPQLYSGLLCGPWIRPEPLRFGVRHGKTGTITAPPAECSCEDEGNEDVARAQPGPWGTALEQVLATLVGNAPRGSDIRLT